MDILYNRFKKRAVSFQIALVALLIGGGIFLSACSNSSDLSALVTPSNSEREAYVSVSLRTIGRDTSNKTDHTINEDGVEHVRLLIFKHANGELVYNKIHPMADLVNFSKEIEVKVGRYDFFFVSGENAENPRITEALNAIHYRDGLYQSAALARIDFDGVQSKPKLFLMTAQLLDQEINMNHISGNPLKLNVKLVRVLSKVNLSVTSLLDQNTKDLKISKIIINNVPRYYSLFPPLKEVYTPSIDMRAPEEIPLGSMSYNTTNVWEAEVFIPEYLRPKTAAPEGNTSLKVYYNKHGVTRSKLLPITHTEFGQHSDHYTPHNYEDLSLSSIVRNTNYKLTARLKGWLEESIEFNWDILPWQLSESKKDFGSIIVEVDSPQDIQTQSGVDISGEGNQVIQIHSGLTHTLLFRAKVKEPIGAVWRFSLTNTLDFQMTGVPDLVGVAGDENIVLTITALKPWTGIQRSTELYLTINGEEVQLVPIFKNNKEEPGPGKRFFIQQIS